MVAATVGVLALQGGFQKHIGMLQRLGVASRRVRTAGDLAGCSALIVPGGESTTMSRLIEATALHDPLVQFAYSHPVMGTCAGLIMMASNVDDARVRPLGIVPFKAQRNAFGRQIDSFVAPVVLALDESRPFRAVFIRSPAIADCGSDIEVLARYRKRAVMLRYRQHFAVAFHPELTDDTRVHDHWLRGFAC